MKPISICLLLPIACIVALPPQYSYYAKEGDQQEPSNEFWSQHFGPEFQHALHFQLGQTHCIDDGNSVGKNVTESISGNKKRSTYIVHNSQLNDQNIREAMGNSMRVHLLQPDEMEALEREMLNYARGNGMMQSPVVVNLPESEGSLAKNPGQENPVVLNLPPVVYHSNVNGANHQRFSDMSPYAKHGYLQSSFYDQMQIPFRRVSSPYAHGGIEMRAPYETHKPSEEEVMPAENEAKIPSYTESRQKFDDTIQPAQEESKQPDESESQGSSNTETKV